jgi:hypothetical protein
MLTISYPKNFELIKPYFPEEIDKKYLYISAQNESELYGIIQFIYKDDTVIIKKIWESGKIEDLSIFDGMIRGLLFPLYDVGCTKCVIETPQVRYLEYFKSHEFLQDGENWFHEDFNTEFFMKPCEGCKDK